MRAVRKIERLGGLRTERNALASFYILNTGGTPNYGSRSCAEVNPALSPMGQEGQLWPWWHRRVVAMFHEPENIVIEVVREAKFWPRPP